MSKLTAKTEAQLIGVLAAREEFLATLNSTTFGTADHENADAMVRMLTTAVTALRADLTTRMR